MGNRLYVPEIGDTLKLTKDWSFDLYPEDRNVSLGSYFGYEKYGFRWVDIKKIGDKPKKDYVINYPTDDEIIKGNSKFSLLKYSMLGLPYQDREAAYKRAEDESESYQAYKKSFGEWYDKAKEIALDKIIITLPKGVILQVDRIYIRKGSSDFSSITFYAKELGEINITSRWSGKTTKRKALRFWANLKDCNKIEFELLPKPK